MFFIFSFILIHTDVYLVITLVYILVYWNSSIGLLLPFFNSIISFRLCECPIFMSLIFHFCHFIAIVLVFFSYSYLFEVTGNRSFWNGILSNLRQKEEFWNVYKMELTVEKIKRTPFSCVYSIRKTASF